MAKNLVIVESPAKAKTIEGILGKDFTVKSSFGHIRDLLMEKIFLLILTMVLNLIMLSLLIKRR